MGPCHVRWCEWATSILLNSMTSDINSNGLCGGYGGILLCADCQWSWDQKCITSDQDWCLEQVLSYFTVGREHQEQVMESTIWCQTVVFQVRLGVTNPMMSGWFLVSLITLYMAMPLLTSIWVIWKLLPQFYQHRTAGDGYSTPVLGHKTSATVEDESLLPFQGPGVE